MAEIKTATPLFLTAKGLTLQAKVQAGKTPLRIVRAVIGDGYLDSEQPLLELTELIHEIPSHQSGTDADTATVDLTRKYYEDSSAMSMITVSVKNGNHEFSYLREFKIIAIDPDVGEIPYAYCNLGDEALPLPTYDGHSHVSYECDFPTAITNADNVQVNITLPAEVTAEEFQEHTNDAAIHMPIYIGGKKPASGHYLWFAPYERPMKEDITLQADRYDGDESKLHAEINSENYTVKNSTVTASDDEVVVTIM